MTDTHHMAPTDAEIFVVAREAGLLPDNSHPAPETRAARKHSNAVQAFARAVLAKWGTPPAEAGEPIGVVGYTVHGTQYVNWLSKAPAHGTPIYTTPQHTQAQAGAVPLTESEMGEGWRKFQETLEDRMAADPAGVRSMGREHWLSWAHWKAACNFALGIKGGQHGAE